MEKVFIVTDSTAGVPEEFINSKNIKVLPLTIEFEGSVYKDGIDIDEQILLEMLTRGEELPKTSQVNPKSFLDQFEELTAEGYKIISIHISSGLSGTYQSACIARDMMENGEDVFVVDSKGVSFATGALVIEAIKMIESGMSVEDTTLRLEELSERVRVAFAVDELEYIRKGGRISSVHAAIGSLLNIKPILSMTDGKIDVLDKVRGKKKALKRMIDYINDEGIDTSLTFAIGNVAGEREMEDFYNQLPENINKEEAMKVKVGSVIATYAGPGTVGVFFFA
ncbi:MAG: DegV family protein, partial [Clostridium sp.]